MSTGKPTRLVRSTSVLIDSFRALHVDDQAFVLSQIMYARSEDSIREQIENFMPFYNDMKPTDILIGAPTKL